MRRLPVLLFITLFILPPLTRGHEKPLVIIQGRIITTKEFNRWCREVLGDIPLPKEAKEREATLSALLRILVEREMMLLEAEREGIEPKIPDKTPKVVRDDLTVAELLSRKLSNVKVSEEEVLKRYRKMFPKRKRKRLVLFSSIKFYDLGEARKVLYRLRRLPPKKRMVEFNIYKKREESYLNELNHRYFSQDELPDEFTPVFKARKGEVVGPVVTEDGIFLFFIEDVKVKRPPPLSRVKSKIKELILSEKKEKAMRAFIEGLYKKYRPIINYQLLHQYSTLERKSPDGGAR